MAESLVLRCRDDSPRQLTNVDDCSILFKKGSCAVLGDFQLSKANTVANRKVTQYNKVHGNMKTS